MVPWTLAAGALLTLAVGLLYGLAGVRLASRARAAGHAMALFSLFWFGVAVFGVTDGLWSLAVPLLAPPVAVGVTILHVKTLAGTVGFFGLVYYLAYLYTGSRRMLAPLGAFYAGVYVLVMYGHVVADPIGQEAQTWRSGLVYRNPGTPWSAAGTIALFAPPLVAAILYARLLRVTRDPAQRRRVLAVSLALGAFFGGLLLGWLHGALAWWPIAEKMLALATIALVLWSHPHQSAVSSSSHANAS